MKRESRRDRELADRLDGFRHARAHGERWEMWVAWYAYRSLRERWNEGDQFEAPAAYELFAQVIAWQNGKRPPTTYHEANARIRAQIRAGRLRARGVGL